MSNLGEKLHSAPFVRLLLPFIAGIVLGDYFSPGLKWVFLVLSIIFLSLLPFFISVSFKRELLFGIFLVPALLFLGLFIALDLRYRPEPLSKKEYFAVFEEYPLEKEKSYRAVIRLAESEIKVLAYFEKGGFVAKAEPGSVVWFRGEPELLQKTGNPFEFDYQAYAIRNQIGHRIYLKNGNFYFLQVNKIPNPVEFSLIIRDRLLKIIENSGLKGEVLHLVSAVSLGAREELEPETTQSFSKTGVTHVLAVSGMNVGIIFVVLDWMLQFLKRKKSGVILQTILILAGVWGYALITGLSASVLRAAAMFSFIVIGKSLSRNPNIYNTLAASAFVLLCFNPSLIYDVGFQLSYAAVFSIVYFHPFIYGLCYFKYWIPDQIWTLMTVSVAAQIGTLPFLLHYFHQFPTWFLLANLMVIPLVTLILYLSFIVFAVAPVIPFLGMVMTRILDWAGQGMLFSVRFVEKLPYSILEGIYPSDIMLFIIVVFSILITAFILFRSGPFLIAALCSITILLIINNIEKHQRLSANEIVVFNVSGKILVALTQGIETFWLTSEKPGTWEKLNYYIKPYQGFRGIKKSSMICLSDSLKQTGKSISCRKNFLNFRGITLSFIDHTRAKEKDWEHFPVSDFIILSGRSQINTALVQRYHPKTVIIDTRPPLLPGNANSSPPTVSGNIQILNTNQRGAVQIKFKPTANGEKINLRCEYFNQL
jgi:competence protein ComEC